MENKIAIASLALLLAQSTGKSKKLCEDFLREFFKLAAETLEKGEPLKVKGFGSFKVTEVEGRSSVNINTGEPHEIAPYKKVVFTPAKELASAINAPFEDFDSVEMDDDMPEDIFIENEFEKEAEETANALEETINEGISDEAMVSEQRLEEGSIEEGEDDDITYEAYTEFEEQPQEETSHPGEYNFENVKAPSAISVDIQENTNMDNPEQIAPVVKDEITQNENAVEEYEYQQPVKSRFGLGFIVGALSTFAICAVIFMLGCFFDWWPVNFGNVKDAIAEQVEQNEIPQFIEDTVQDETLPEKEPVYDTVSTTRYLTTIAREHYGNYNFWPYIYLENESILGHPDRITPGTKVVVPELAKYGVDPKNKDDVTQAKRKAVEIYARFK